MDYNEEHFYRYINNEFWRDNYGEIIKTGFDFPKIFISCIRHDLWCRFKKRNHLLDKYYQNPDAIYHNSRSIHTVNLGRL